MSDNSIPIDVIVCSYNNKESLIACLESVKNNHYPNIKIIIVDDGSIDGTEEYLKEKNPEMLYLKNDVNKGPAYCRNLALTYCQGKYVVTLDDDVVLTPQWLRAMVGVLECNPDIGICASKLIFLGDSNKLNSAGGGANRFGQMYDIGIFQEARKYNAQRDVVFACSAAMVFRRRLYQKIGGFDPTYFYGFEDADFGWRANIAGYRVRYIPEAVAYHQMSRSVNRWNEERRDFLRRRNSIRTVIKNYNLLNLGIFLPLIFLRSLLRFFLDTFLKRKVQWVIWKAWADVCLDIPRIFKERSRVQRLRQKSDRQIMDLFD